MEEMQVQLCMEEKDGEVYYYIPEGTAAASADTTTQVTAEVEQSTAESVAAQIPSGMQAAVNDKGEIYFIAEGSAPAESQKNYEVLLDPAVQAQLAADTATMVTTTDTMPAAVVADAAAPNTEVVMAKDPSGSISFTNQSDKEITIILPPNFEDNQATESGTKTQGQTQQVVETAPSSKDLSSIVGNQVSCLLLDNLSRVQC